MNDKERDQVTAAWIARQAGVGRAAVANWRKRYPNFPQPVAGGVNNPMFSWVEVQRWLVETGKADQLAASGRTGTGTQLIGDASSPPTDGDRPLPKLTRWELLARVMVSLLPRLGDGDASRDDEEPPLVLDPACRDATVLAAVAERFDDHVRLAGQAPDEVDAAAVRQAFPGLGLDVHVGDALRVDRFAGSRGTARAVLCVPPHAARQWPAAELAADPRWRFGLPDSVDLELAWVQHCVAHLRPRGVAVVAMSPVTGVRPSGQHVRAALVRAGVLRDVIALPAGLTRSGKAPRTYGFSSAAGQGETSGWSISAQSWTSRTSPGERRVGGTGLSRSRTHRSSGCHSWSCWTVRRVWCRHGTCACTEVVLRLPWADHRAPGSPLRRYRTGPAETGGGDAHPARRRDARRAGTVVGNHDPAAGRHAP